MPKNLLGVAKRTVHYKKKKTTFENLKPRIAWKNAFLNHDTTVVVVVVAFLSTAVQN